MSGRAAYLDEFFEKVHETLIDKYFVVAGGHSVWIDLTELVLRRPADGRRWINVGGRALQNIYSGLGWAPKENYGGFSCRIFAANVEKFKRCMQWKSEEPAMQMPIHERVQIELFTILQSEILPKKIIPLLPRSDVKLSDILDRFAEAARAE